MSVVLVVALGIPLVGALAAVFDPARLRTRSGSRPVPTVAAAAAAVAWAVVATADSAPEFGRIVADPLAAAAVAGLAVLVASRLPVPASAAAGALCAVTVLGVAATIDVGDGGTDRPLAAGVAALVALAVALTVTGSTPLGAQAAVVAGGTATAVALVVDPADLSATTIAALVVVGAGSVVLGALSCPPAAMVVPAVVLAIVRTVGLEGLDVGTSDRSDLVAAAGLAVGAVAVLALALGARRARPRSDLDAAAYPGGLAAVLAGICLLAQDPTGLRSAGLLVAAGGVLVAAARPVRPAPPRHGTAVPVVALSGLLPGTAAVLAAAGRPVGVLGGTALVLAGVVVAVAVLPPGAVDPGLPVGAEAWRTVPAVVFGLVPLWGWTGADLRGYAAAVGTAAAAGALAAVGLVAWWIGGNPIRAVRDRVPTDRLRAVGRLRRRRPATDHASNDPLAEEAEDDGPLQVDDPRRSPLSEASERPATQHPLAQPPRPVRVRAPGGRDRGRGRLRPGSGRPPG